MQFLSLSLSFSLSLSLPPSLCVCLPFPLSLCLSLSLFLALSLCLYLSLSLSLARSLARSLFLSLVNPSTILNHVFKCGITHSYMWRDSAACLIQATGVDAHGAMGWLRLVGSFKIQVSFAEYHLVYKALLQKRHVILWSLLIAATR